jgi:hypothetical protein
MVQPNRNAGTERFAQIDVDAARLRSPRAELAVAQHPRQREQAADRPQRQQRQSRAGLLGHRGRGAEDAAADHAAHDNGGAIPDAQPAQIRV